MNPQQYGTAFRKRIAQWERFNAWERAHRVELDPATTIARISSLYHLLHADARRREVDPTGINETHRILSFLTGSSR